MSLKPVTASVDIGGKTLSFESGEMARQAHGSVVARLGDTVVFSAVCYGRNKNLGFFPLTVDYREMRYAAGKFPGGFFKREGRPTTKEILSCRLIDRPIRPQFPKGFMREVAVSARVLSADMQNDPDVVAMNAAMLATAASGLPFANLLGAVRVGLVDGELVAFPTIQQTEESDLDLVIAASADAICMVEAGAAEIGEDQLLEAIDFGHAVIKKIISAQKRMLKKIARPTIAFEPQELDKKLLAKWKRKYSKALTTAHFTKEKHTRKEALKAVYERVCKEQKVGEDGGPDSSTAADIFEALKTGVVREQILKNEKRADGRGLEDIRAIECKANLLPRTHGSALFTRGETQALIVLTLGNRRDEQKVDGLLEEPIFKKFILHYNFPAYCVGEAWPNRGPKRREIGHGALAERAVAAILPSSEQFPYTMRLVSEIMESNGSSSMATVCGGTLALMDAGVPIRRPVAGIAMGLVTDGKKFKVLSDILGLEDHCGDMDFKVAGSGKGVTALQMDIKVKGIPRDVMAQALQQAREGRIHILRKMLAAIGRPRKTLSEFAPRLEAVPIPLDRIGTLIGPGGKTIRKLQEENSVSIDIDDAKGRVLIFGKSDSNFDEAVQQVRMLTEDVEVGAVYTGKVTSLKDFGVFVELVPGQEGLVHVSELSDGYVERVDQFVKLGEKIKVKVIDVDPLGRIKLSARRALESAGT